MDRLDRFRAPIVYDAEHEACRFDDKVEDSAVWQLPGLYFTADELRSLLTMDRLIAGLRPGVLSELVNPQRLVHYRDNWYLDAFCHKRQAPRTFAVDAIAAASVIDKPCKDVSEGSLDRHFASG